MLRIVTLFCLCISFFCFGSAHSDYRPTASGQYANTAFYSSNSHSHFTVGQTYERDLQIGSGRLKLRISSNNFSNYVSGSTGIPNHSYQYSNHYNPHNLFHSNVETPQCVLVPLVNYNPKLRKIVVYRGLNTLSDCKEACKKVWEKRIKAGELSEMNYAMHVATCFELYSYPVFRTYMNSVRGCCEAIVELCHKIDDLNEEYRDLRNQLKKRNRRAEKIMREIAQETVKRQPELSSYVKKKIWSEHVDTLEDVSHKFDLYGQDLSENEADIAATALFRRAYKLDYWIRSLLSKLKSKDASKTNKLKECYGSACQQELHQRAVEVLNRFAKLNRAFADVPFIKMISDAGVWAASLSIACTQSEDLKEAEKSVHFATLLLSFAEDGCKHFFKVRRHASDIGFAELRGLAKKGDELVCFFLTHTHRFLESSDVSPVKYAAMIKGVDNLHGSDKAEERLRTTDFFMNNVFKDGDVSTQAIRCKKHLKWAVKELVRMELKVAKQRGGYFASPMANVMSKVRSGTVEIINKGGYRSKVDTPEKRKILRLQRVRNYKEILRANLSVDGGDAIEKKKLIYYGFKMVENLENSFLEEDDWHSMACRGRLDAIVKTLKDPNTKIFKSYEISDVIKKHAPEFVPSERELKNFSGTPLQHFLQQELLDNLHEGSFLDVSSSLSEVGVFTDVTCAAASLAFECNKSNECHAAGSFVDFSRGMLSVAKSAADWGGIKKAARGFPVYISDCAYRFVKNTLFVSDRICSGIEEGRNDISKALNTGFQRFMRDGLLKKDVMGDVSNSQEFIELQTKIFDVKRKELRRSLSSFVARVRTQPIRETIGESIEILSRAAVHGAVITTVVLGVAITANAVEAAIVSGRGILAAKEFIRPLTARVLRDGTVVAEVAATSVAARWKAIVAGLSQGLSYLFRFIEPIAHLYASAQGGGGGGGGSAGGGAESSYPKETGTVWDDITPTQECYVGTKIPRSFEIKVGKYKLWVHGNATKHMNEYISRFDTEFFSMKIRCQIILKSFQASVEEAMKQWGNLPPDRFFGRFGAWEIGINTSTGVIYHALMK